MLLPFIDSMLQQNMFSREFWSSKCHRLPIAVNVDQPWQIVIVSISRRPLA